MFRCDMQLCIAMHKNKGSVGVATFSPHVLHGAFFCNCTVMHSTVLLYCIALQRSPRKNFFNKTSVDDVCHTSGKSGKSGTSLARIPHTVIVSHMYPIHTLCHVKCILLVIRKLAFAGWNMVKMASKQPPKSCWTTIYCTASRCTLHSAAIRQCCNCTMLRHDGVHVQTTSMRLWTFNSSYTYDEDEKENYGDDEEVDEDDEDGNGRVQFRAGK